MKILIAISFIISFSANAQTAQEYFNKGLDKSKSKNYRGSITDYDNAINLDPNYSMAIYNRGTSKFYLNDFKGAIADFDKAIVQMPDYTNAYANRGASKLKMEDRKGAIQDFDMVLKLDPKNEQSYFMRGQAKLGSGDMKGGCYDLSQASELGNAGAEKYLKQYCKNIDLSAPDPKSLESLKIDWPDAEGWRVASNQEDEKQKVVELLRNTETFDNWTEIGTMMVYPYSQKVPSEVTMNVMFENAKKTCPIAKLTFVEKDDNTKYPWIIFKIECGTDAPESQVWQIIQGAADLFVNFRAVKQKSVPDDLKRKWVDFFKTATIVNP